MATYSVQFVVTSPFHYRHERGTVTLILNTDRSLYYHNPSVFNFEMVHPNGRRLFVFEAVEYEKTSDPIVEFNAREIFSKIQWE